MTSYLMLLLLKQKERSQKISKINQINLKLSNLKFPEKGQLFIHNDNLQYNFFQFTGKKWVEIK